MTQAISHLTASRGDGFVRLGDRLTALSGWRRAAVAFATGAVATLALAPTHLVPLLWLAFPVLLLLLRGATVGQAFRTGWWFGFGHFVFGLYWISVALFVDIARWWWAVPLAVCALPAVLAVFTGAATGLFVWAKRRFGLSGVAAVLAFAICWTLGEWLRGHLFTGFPWNLIGYAWVGVLPVLQAASVLGAYGLGLVTVAVAGLPVLLAESGRAPGRRWGAPLAGLAVLAAVAAWGGWRLAAAPAMDDPAASVPGIVIRVVQPNIPQDRKWDIPSRLANLNTLLTLSGIPGSGAGAPVTHVVWPETSVPFVLSRNPEVAQAIGRVTPPGGLSLVGTTRVVADPDGNPRYFNSLEAVDRSGRVVAHYDKAHLVPFGEYLPLRRWLPFGDLPAVAATIDISPGPGLRTLALPGLPLVSPLICYEVIFPGNVVDEVQTDRSRAQWLLNVTNDAWYGETAGPYQHFATAQVRAVEEGLPIVRAAITGISGIVDAYGRVVGRLALGEQGVLDRSLPISTQVSTVYGRWGDWVLVGLLFALSTAIAFFVRAGRVLTYPGMRVFLVSLRQGT